MRQWTVEYDGDCENHSTLLGPIELFVTIEKDTWDWSLHPDEGCHSCGSRECVGHGDHFVARNGLAAPAIRAKALAEAFACIASWLDS